MHPRMQIGAVPVENSMKAPKKTINRITQDSAKPLPGTYSDKTIIQKDTCNSIAMTWKQPKCLSADEWIKKV